jgi:fructose-1,6-bisphosphatase/inositol monophosphatase family enzyme
MTLSAAAPLALLHRAADAAVSALATLPDAVGEGVWQPVAPGAAQHRSDLTADAAVLAVLDASGVGVLSEESGLRRPEAGLVVVVDPLDGSTNAAHRLPWYATSLCAVDDQGPLAAVVHDHGSGRRYEAVRGGGARCDGRLLAPRAVVPELSGAVVALSGLPPAHLGWAQFRALGAAALDLCAVADGRLDAFVDCSVDAHGVWDYLGALLVCSEAGVPVVDRLGRDLVVLDPAARRTPVAAGDVALLDALLGAYAAASAAIASR